MYDIIAQICCAREGRGRGKKREGRGRGGEKEGEGEGGREGRGGGKVVREGGVLTAALPTPYATLKRYLKPPADDTLTMSPCFAGTIILAACHAAT